MVCCPIKFTMFGEGCRSIVLPLDRVRLLKKVPVDINTSTGTQSRPGAQRIQPTNRENTQKLKERPRLEGDLYQSPYRTCAPTFALHRRSRASPDEHTGAQCPKGEHRQQ
jgi:hypothetical protein